MHDTRKARKIATSVACNVRCTCTLYTVQCMHLNGKHMWTVFGVCWTHKMFEFKEQNKTDCFYHWIFFTLYTTARGSLFCKREVNVNVENTCTCTSTRTRTTNGSLTMHFYLKFTILIPLLYFIRIWTWNSCIQYLLF